MPLTTNHKREEVYEFIRTHGSIDQPTINNHFLTVFGYNNINTARVGISRMLTALKEDGRITNEKRINKSSGSLDMNIWRVKQ
jgi:hypothetical protein